MNKQTTLKKDLPGCPAGRIFKEDIGGDYFHSMTDDEVIEGKLRHYKFTKDDVFYNPSWFTIPEVVKLTPSEIDTAITEKYEPFEKDFKLLWKEVVEEGRYKTFENWYSDFLRWKTELAVKAVYG